ncbi:MULTISPECIES: PEP-CTERM sorting domain-containing protein [Microcystis]|uniref:PEP-CTERM sorting domain-containing protein n=1 Tax=Microcystis TaxID=1125 RepID=UPI00168046D9|nr:PEP-CTERM sorting domain-containing protein [Microcystis wesenbergii]MBD2118432.1 PEP-CTERM sorting domain-containing protein [Microcystis wesenbergii FACHB-1339]
MMTTNKLTKTFASGSLAIGVLAGAVLTATSASAFGNSVITTWEDWAILGNPLVLHDGTTATYVSGSIQAELLDDVGLFLINDEYQFLYDATTLAAPDPNGTQNGSFTYTITFAQPVSGVAIDSSVTATYGTVTKTIDGILNPPLVSVNGSEDPLVGFQTISPQLSLTVTDTISNPNGPGEALNDLTNNFEIHKVPEPGTILGLLAVGGLGLVSRFKKQK